MISDEYRYQISTELSALGGTPDQIQRIGNIVFTLAFLDSSRDAEYLLEEMKDPDPLIQRACKIMWEAIT